MSADNIVHLNPNPSAKDAMDAPIDDMPGGEAIMRAVSDELVRQARWWSGWARAWEDFWRAYWRRPW